MGAVGDVSECTKRVSILLSGYARGPKTCMKYNVRVVISRQSGAGTSQMGQRRISLKHDVSNYVILSKDVSFMGFIGI